MITEACQHLIAYRRNVFFIDWMGSRTGILSSNGMSPATGFHLALHYRSYAHTGDTGCHNEKYNRYEIHHECFREHLFSMSLPCSQIRSAFDRRTHVTTAGHYGQAWAMRDAQYILTIVLSLSLALQGRSDLPKGMKTPPGFTADTVAI